MSQENSEKYVNHYINLRNEVSTEVERLNQLHATHINCKKGCSACCMDFKIFPLEFTSIYFHLYGKYPDWEKITTEGDESETCVWLENSLCTIYEHRPIICRSHGTPMLFFNDESDEFELSLCDLNFLKAEDVEFDEDNCYAQDRFNSTLFSINSNFIKNMKQPVFSPFELISLQKLKVKP